MDVGELKELAYQSRVYDWGTSYRTPGKSFIGSPGLLVICALSYLLAYSFLLLLDLSWLNMPNGSFKPGYTLGTPMETGLAEPWEEAKGLLFLIILILFVSSFGLQRRFPELAEDSNGNLPFAVLLGIIYLLILVGGVYFSLFGKIHYCGEAATLQGCNIIPPQTPQALSHPFWIMTGTQAAAFTFTVWVYTHPLLPEWFNNPNHDVRKNARVHLTNWWRYTQAVLSVAAIGVAGLVIPFLLGQLGFGRTRILPIALTFVAPLGAVLIFSTAKMRLVEKKLTP